MNRDYPSRWMFDEHRAFTDQWLLATFLHGNSNWEIIFPVDKMVNDFPEKFAEHGLSSNFYNSDFWIRKIR